MHPLSTVFRGHPYYNLYLYFIPTCHQAIYHHTNILIYQFHLFIHQLVGIICFYFFLLWIMLLWTFMTHFCMNMFSLLWGAYLKLKLLGHVVTQYLAFFNVLPDCFPKWLHFSFPPTVYEGPVYLHPCQHLLFNWVFDSHHPSGYLTIVLVCIFSNGKWCWTFFLCVY